MGLANACQTAAIMLHCVYGAYHLSRPAGHRTPGSSGAYHAFAALTDLVVLPLYAYGALTVRNNGSQWTTLLPEQWPLEYFIPATYYTLIGSGGAHVLSLTISLWLGLMFRRILKMPPDMNPLESHLTARSSHKRNKSSVATTSTYADSLEKRLSGTAIENHRRSGQPYEDLSRPPSVPFMRTRQGSETSLPSSLRTRDSRTDLPSRQYQIVPGNASPRHSGASKLSVASKRASGGPPSPTKLTSYRNTYTEIPLDDDHPSSRPPTGTGTRPGTNSTYRTSYTSQPPSSSAGTPPRNSTPTSRQPRFTEAWFASESLVSRTQAHLNRNQALAQLPSSSSSSVYSTNQGKFYAPLELPYDDTLSSEDEENEPPHPLRSNPSSPRVPASPRQHSHHHHPRAPLAKSSIASLHRDSPLSEISLNLSSAATDISSSARTNQQPRAAEKEKGGEKRTTGRKTSIQAESEFYTKPYGQLRAATPPVLLATPAVGGAGAGGGGRQVSSGNDYGVAAAAATGKFGGRWSVFGRRNVSGKVAEEGRGGGMLQGGRWD